MAKTHTCKPGNRKNIETNYKLVNSKQDKLPIEVKQFTEEKRDKRTNSDKRQTDRRTHRTVDRKILRNIERKFASKNRFLSDNIVSCWEGEGSGQS